MTDASGTRERAWPSGIAAVTLFVEDLQAARAFYGEVFGLPIFYEDANSVVFKFGSTLVNLLTIEAAPKLVEPASVANREAGVRFQFTVEVDDVDAKRAELIARGVTLLNWTNGPALGIRTASFRDPAGHIWELAR